MVAHQRVGKGDGRVIAFVQTNAKGQSTSNCDILATSCGRLLIFFKSWAE